METLRTYLTLAIIMLAAWLGPAAGAAQGAPPPPAKPGEEFPLHIIASKLEADQNAGIAIFTGQVKATYGDSILYADQLKVYFIPKQAGARASGGKEAAAGTAPGAAAGKATGGSPLDELGGDQIDHIVAFTFPVKMAIPAFWSASNLLATMCRGNSSAGLTAGGAPWTAPAAGPSQAASIMRARVR